MLVETNNNWIVKFLIWLGVMEIYRTNARPQLESKANADVQMLIAALHNNGWRLQFKENDGEQTRYSFGTVDREVQLFVQNDRGDLVGAFEKINETRIEVLTERLTKGLVNPVTVAADLIDHGVIRGLSIYFDPLEPKRIDSETILNEFEVWLQNCKTAVLSLRNQ